MRPTPLSLLLALPLLAACDAEDASPYPGSWSPPVVQVPANGDYPACTGDQGCPWGERCGPGGQCAADGLGREPAPAFALPDGNGNSATHGRTVSLQDQAGRVTLVYFGLSTCPVCWNQVVRIQSLLQSLQDAGGPAATALVVNHPSGEGTIAQMGRFVRLPILQDVAGAPTWRAFDVPGDDVLGAQKDTLAVVDPSGFVAARWQVVDVAAQAGEIEAAIRAAGW